MQSPSKKSDYQSQTKFIIPMFSESRSSIITEKEDNNNNITITNIQENNNLYQFAYSCTDTNKPPKKCLICQRSLKNKITFLCSEYSTCPYIFFCINCFLTNKHDKNHGYHILDSLNFPLFNREWNVKNELKLLSSLLYNGYENWDNISYQMESYTSIQCESHYKTFYLPLKIYSIIIDDNKNIIYPKAEYNKNLENNVRNKIIEEPIYTVNDTEDIMKKSFKGIGSKRKLKKEGTENVGEILGYCEKRNDFDLGYCYELDYNLAELEFCVTDTDKEKIMKKNVLIDYNNILKRREDEKNLILSKGLLDLKNQTKIESKLSEKEFKILTLLKPFLRFYENPVFFDIFEGFYLENEMINMLKTLEKVEKKHKKKINKKYATVIEIKKIMDKFKKSYQLNNTLELAEEDNNYLSKTLCHRIGRYIRYQKLIQDDDENEGNRNYDNLLDEDEYKFFKEMPVAMSSIYDIKLRISYMIDKYINNRNILEEKITELLNKYDNITDELKKEIFKFYIKKIYENYKDLSCTITNESI